MPVTRKDFLPKSWIYEDEQTAKDSKKHALIIKTSQELISAKVDECIHSAVEQGKSPLEIIDDGFKGGQRSAFNTNMTRYDSRTWGLVYNLAESMMDYRDSLSDGPEKTAVEDMLGDLSTLWNNLKDTDAREGLLNKLQSWLKEKPSSSSNFDHMSKILAQSYFVVNGLSLKLGSINGIQKSLAGGFGIDISETQQTMDETLKPLIVQKYQQALTQQLSDPKKAASIIEANKTDTISILSKNIDLAKKLLESGDQKTKAFLSGNEMVVAALIRADKSNILPLLAQNPQKVANVFKDNADIRDKHANDLKEDMDFANALINMLAEKNLLTVIQPILEVHSELALQLKNGQPSDSEVSNFLKTFIRLGSSHVDATKRLGGRISASLAMSAIKIKTPEVDNEKKKNLQEKCERLQALDRVLSSDDKYLAMAFWAEYNTQEKLDTLKEDLSSLSVANKTNLQRHFKSVFFLTDTGILGNTTSVIASAFSWLQTTANPLVTGGVSPLSEILKGAVKEALSKSQDTLAKQAQEIMPNVDVKGETMAEKLSSISESLKGKTNAQIINELKNELITLINNLPSVEAFSSDKATKALSDAQILHNEPSDEDKHLAYEKVLKDFDSVIEIIGGHQRMIEILEQIEKDMNSLEEKGVDVGDLRKAFDTRVDETIKHGEEFYKKTLHGDKPENKIQFMKQTVAGIKDEIEGMKKGSQALLDNLTNNIGDIQHARTYVKERSQTWAHFFMKIFSPSYRAMYIGLKKAVTDYEQGKISEAKAIEGIQKAVNGEKGYTSTKIATLKARINQSKESFEKAISPAEGTGDVEEQSSSSESAIRLGS